MNAAVRTSRRLSADPAREQKEPWTEQVASFIEFFIYLLLLKSFFLPLFIIPTGSMAQTLYGEHLIHTCPNCGTEYPVNWPPPPDLQRGRNGPPTLVCPNCRWQEYFSAPQMRAPLPPGGEHTLETSPRPRAGDRIFVHGWPFAPVLHGVPGCGPQRWDVVVFKVPNDGLTNYIKRLIGLPGETIELIDGDVFIDGEITHKPTIPQESLWFAFFDQDYVPREAGEQGSYHPRWVAVEAEAGWQALDTRVFRFDGAEEGVGAIQFATDPRPEAPVGEVTDFYSYNAGHQPGNIVRDVRLSGEVRIEEGAGWVEFSTTKDGHTFFARLQVDGQLTLSHLGPEATEREEWGSTQVDATRPVVLGLSNVDYQVHVLVDGQRVLSSTREQYGIGLEEARALAGRRDRPPAALRVRASDVRMSLRHLLIERDVYYTHAPAGRNHRPTNASCGNPLTLNDDAYFCCGDNSPNSLDSRYWTAEMLGPHLREAYQAGRYQLGTVPADQMVGRAFFVYWPGFMPLTSHGPNLKPDLGRVRWIR